MNDFKQLKSKLKSNKMNKTSFLKAFDDPFKYLPGGEFSQEFEQYNYNNICLTTFNKKMKSETIDLSGIILSRDIEKVLWYKEGKNDEEDWHFIATLPINGQTKYVYLTAWCVYTGFDCLGGMKMYISAQLGKIMNLAIDQKVLKMIEKDLKIYE